MKSNITGTSKRLTLGRGVTFRSDNSNLLRVMDDMNAGLMADVQANRFDYQKIQGQGFTTSEDRSYFNNNLKLSGNLSFAGDSVILVSAGSETSTGSTALTLNTSGVSIANAYEVDILTTVGTLYLSVEPRDAEDLAYILQNFFTAKNMNMKSVYDADQQTITISTTDGAVSLKYIEVSTYNFSNISFEEISDSDPTRVYTFDNPLYNVNLLGNPTAPTPPEGDNSTRVATTAFVERALVGGVVYKGTFDASAGNYNALSSSKVGWMYYVDKAGTISGVEWNVGDYLLVNAAGATNVTKIDNTESADIVRLTATQTLTNKTLTSPALTGTPTAPTAAAGTNNTQIATTAFVNNAVTIASGNFVDLTNNQTVGGNKTFTNSVKVGAAGTNTTGINLGNNGQIELFPASAATNGGLIDFHFSGNTADFTSRIIEDAQGKLSLIATNGVTISSYVNNSLITRANGSVPYFQTKRTDVSLATPPTVNTQVGYLNFLDGNNIDVGFIQSIITSSGQVITSIQSADTADHTCGIHITLTNGNTLGTVSLTNANIPQTDSSTKIATTQWVSQYSFPLNNVSATSGTVNLTTNKVYKMSINGATTFSLGTPPNTAIYNQIKLMLNVTTVATINWGTTLFYNGNPPPVTAAGQYAIYFDWEANISQWVCGGMAVATAD